ncbi:MAG: CbtB-domain containing protein [Mesorhizobium sp.]|jgi:presenilin-like A22 family membrane protease|nr:CbtB-domain containing protein [Mesorhizobium sp.]MBL8579191.1 CbtB-domain containing protein [Mesorhizobium sp.]
MSDATFSPGFAPTSIPVKEILPWALFGGLVLLIILYFVTAGQSLPGQDMIVHEFFHDGRHLLGFPCH